MNVCQTGENGYWELVDFSESDTGPGAGAFCVHVSVKVYTSIHRSASFCLHESWTRTPMVLCILVLAYSGAHGKLNTPARACLALICEPIHTHTHTGMYDEENIMHTGGSLLLKTQTFLIYFAPRFCAFLWYWTIVYAPDSCYIVF